MNLAILPYGFNSCYSLVEQVRFSTQSQPLGSFCLFHEHEVTVISPENCLSVSSFMNPFWSVDNNGGQQSKQGLCMKKQLKSKLFYSCSEEGCSKVFKQSNHLKLHARIHDKN